MHKLQFERLALALRAFRASDGFSLTSEQYEALYVQIALACDELSTDFDFSRFEDACLKPGKPGRKN